MKAFILLLCLFVAVLALGDATETAIPVLGNARQVDKPEMWSSGVSDKINLLKSLGRGLAELLVSVLREILQEKTDAEKSNLEMEPSGVADRVKPPSNVTRKVVEFLRKIVTRIKGLLEDDNPEDSTDQPNV